VQDFLQRSISRPLLKIPVTGLVGRIPIGELAPLGSGAENPERSVQDLALILARPTAPIAAPPILRQQRLDEFPLRVGQVQATTPGGGPALISRGSLEQALGA